MGILHKSNGIWERKCEVLYGVLISMKRKIIGKTLWFKMSRIYNVLMNFFFCISNETNNG